MATKDNKVKCEMTSVPETKEMNDRDYLNDMLESMKNLGISMTIVMNEASNETLFEEIEPMFKRIKECQRTLFELAWSKGWYTLETAEETKINTKIKELQKLQKELDK